MYQQYQKNHLQEWWFDEKFSHQITIEPTPNLPFKFEEIQQRLRTIVFNLNRNYLGNRFSKFKNVRDKFFFVVIKEVQGNATARDLSLISDAINKAIKEWNPLAEKRNVNAQFNLGEMYRREDGFSLDYETAIKCTNLLPNKDFLFPSPI